MRLGTGDGDGEVTAHSADSGAGTRRTHRDAELVKERRRPHDDDRAGKEHRACDVESQDKRSTIR